MATITDLVTQNKQAALQKLAAQANATAAPIVQLAPAYDTGSIGDNVTDLLHVNLLVTNPAGLTWIDTTPNGVYDSGEPTAVGNTFYDITLTTGSNQLVFYQAAPGKETSAATTISLYVPPSASYNEQQLEQLVTQLGLAYWGRALSPEELALGRQVLQQTSGNPQPIIDYLVTTAEYRLVYPAQDPLSLITAPYLKLFGRNPTPSEITFWLTKYREGLDLHQLPGLLVQNPPSASSDTEALAAKTLVAQLMTAHYDTLLQQANGYEAQLHNIMRNQLAAVVDQTSMETTITTVANGLTATAPPVTASLDPSSDTGAAGDHITALSSVNLQIGNIQSGYFAWIDQNGDSQYTPGTDTPVVNGKIPVTLAPGGNVFVLYQSNGRETSSPTYLTLWRETTAPSAPNITLNPADDDGTPGDWVTSKTLVRLTITNLDPQRKNAWIETDGNGQFDLNTDIPIPTGGTSQTVWVPLADRNNTFQVYQARDDLTSLPNTISIFRLQTTDVVQPGKSASYAGKTISLEFNRPIDWARLDTNGDGKLDIHNLNDTTDSGELGIAWGASGTNPPILNDSELNALQLDLADLSYGGRFVTLSPVTITATDNTQPISGQLTLIFVGVPDVQDGITSNVIFTI